MANTYRLQLSLTLSEDGVSLTPLAALALTDVEYQERWGPVSQRIANGNSWAVQHTLATIKAMVVVVTGNVVLRLGGEEVGHQITVPDGQTRGVFFYTCNDTQLAFDNNSGAEVRVELFMVGD
jgi:hypothetical protein